MEYKLIRSNRKTLALQIKDGEIVVRAPLRAGIEQIESLLLQHKDFIDKHLSESVERKKKKDGIVPLSDEEKRALIEMAYRIIPERAEHYARIIGVKYAKITVRAQRSRWGSCSVRGNLSFNLLLMLTPTEVLDSVIVHELCHLKHMDHSREFYKDVERAYPDYYKWHSYLKENGELLMARL